MDSSDPITVLRLGVAVIVLSYASLLDWRTRRIGNVYWVGLSIAAMVLVPIQILIDEQQIEYALILVPIFAILSDVYLDAGEGTTWAKIAPATKYALAIISLIGLAYAWGEDGYFQYLLAVPVMMLLIVLMYMLDLIRGGADAKALLSIAILFPIYPAVGSIPMIGLDTGSVGEVLFPFAFVVLVTAAIIVAFFPLWFAIRNLSKHEFAFPQGLLGYKMDASSIKGRHVWLMERIEGGTHKTFTRPKANEDLDKEVGLLSDAGMRRIWITPKIPFIVPVLVALIFAAIVGNIFLLFL